MASALSREFLLLAACSIWPPSHRRKNAIRDAAAGSIDWALFLRIVRRHDVVGLVHDGLGRAQIAVPPDIARSLAEQADALVRENLALAAEAVRLQQLFAEANLPVAFIKGVSLAKLAYGDLGIRHSKDLDLLVAPESFPAAAVLVEHAGYRRVAPAAEISDARLRLLMGIRKDFTYVHEHSHSQVELHWRLFLNPYLMDESSLFVSSRVVPLSENRALRTL